MVLGWVSSVVRCLPWGGCFIYGVRASVRFLCLCCGLLIGVFVCFLFAVLICLGFDFAGL